MSRRIPKKPVLKRVTGKITAVIAATCAATALAIIPLNAATAHTPAVQATVSSMSTVAKPTIVLVHGAWADASSWAAVTAGLQLAGYTVLVPPNSLRGLSADSLYLSSYLAQQTSGPVVLVGHSYGGAVITNAATGHANVKALVYVDAFIPDQGESLGSIIAASTSALNVADPTTIFTVNGYPKAPDGDADVYLKPSTFVTDFAQDVPAGVRNVLEAGQLPITLAALKEPSGVPAWKTIPSWDVVGTADRVLPASTQVQMAQRAHATITRVNASHLSMVSRPLTTLAVILKAAKSVR